MKRRAGFKAIDTTTAEHREWITRLERCAEGVDAWRERTKNPVFAVPGSPLAADEIPGLGIEQAAWYSLCTAVEHLAAAFDLLRATNTLYPSAYMTLLRTAYMSAVNSYYVLAADSRAERRLRALRMRAHELSDEKKTYTRLGDARAEDLIARVEEQQARLQEVAERLGSSEQVAKMRYNLTDAVDWAAKKLRDDEGGHLEMAFRSLWNTGSAAAHGQMIYALMRPGQQEVVHQDERGSVVHLTSSLEHDVGPAFVGAFLVANQAFRLYDLRRLPRGGFEVQTPVGTSGPFGVA